MVESGWAQQFRRACRSLTPRTVAGIYVLFGGFWIVTSDRLLHALVGSTAEISRFQTLKGWAFVGGSGALVYGLMKLQTTSELESTRRISRQAQQLQVFNRVLRHNLRNELNQIVGYAERADRAVGVDDVELTQSLRHIEASADRLLEVTGKARRITNLDLGRDRTPVDLVELLEDLVPRLRADHPDAVVRLETPESAVVRANGTISMAFRELIENAIVHNPAPDPEVDVAVRTTRAARARITITDDGPGIDRGEFEPVLAGEETPTDHGSSIGLWLVRWVVTSHDGALDFGVTDRGTTVTIDLPLDALEQTATRVSPGS